jgi:hypothetical protein
MRQNPAEIKLNGSTQAGADQDLVYRETPTSLHEQVGKLRQGIFNRPATNTRATNELAFFPLRENVHDLPEIFHTGQQVFPSIRVRHNPPGTILLLYAEDSVPGAGQHVDIVRSDQEL